MCYPCLYYIHPLLYGTAEKQAKDEFGVLPCNIITTHQDIPAHDIKEVSLLVQGLSLLHKCKAKYSCLVCSGTLMELHAPDTF